MFETLTEKLGSVFDGLRRRGVLREDDLDTALREVRVALLEADVALPVVRDFIAKVREGALGEEVTRSVSPGQMVVKIVHDQLVDMLGAETAELNFNVPAPAVVMMVGLQGSGKTTSTAKIAKRLTESQKKKVLMASLDTRRPAAMEQLKVLGEQTGVQTLPIVDGQMPVDIARRALQAAKLSGVDVVMLDTAGRLHVDEGLMSELSAIAAATAPVETLLVADALTGQDAVQVAETFSARVNLTGVVLTRMDGDGRGGAALSMRAVTGQPIKFVGTGEKMAALEAFHPDRVANRILGMGDVVSLVEKAQETVKAEDAERLVKKIKKGQFDLEDYRNQLRQMQNMGGMKDVLKMLPGMGQMQKQMANAKMDDRVFRRQEAIINSMTPEERRKVKLLGAARKRRIAAGSGTSVQDVNRLLKQFEQIAKLMSRMGKKGGKGMPQLPPGFDQLMPR